MALISFKNAEIVVKCDDVDQRDQVYAHVYRKNLQVHVSGLELHVGGGVRDVATVCDCMRVCGIVVTKIEM